MSAATAHGSMPAAVSGPRRRLGATLAAILALVAILALSGCGGSDNGGTEAQASVQESRIEAARDVALAPPRALGQLLMGRYHGTTPSRGFLERVHAGRIGGVIFFADNVTGQGGSIRRATRLLQRAAISGGNPPLLMAIDQEGGIVKRLPGPPHVAPPDMGSRETARRQGRLTGRYLRGLGVNVNLAPVADVPSGPTFIRERTFAETPRQVARRACAFARGLVVEGVAATLKHFPGLGRATANTDLQPTSVDAPAAAIRSGYAPYRACGRSPVTLTMLSSAIYPGLGGEAPAVVTPATYARELRLAGVRGVTISDDLQTPALESVRAPATRALRSGLSIALYAGTEEGSATAYRVLLRRIRAGLIDRRLAARRSGPVLALKAMLEPELTDRFLARRGR